MNDDIKVIGTICAVLLIFFAVTVGVVYGLSYITRNSLEQLGYEAKMVNLDCYAKYEGRWLLCESIVKNQHEVVLK